MCDNYFMNTFKKALMPLFRLLAKPGINNPHTSYEAELMVTGAKPLAIMLMSDLTDELNAKITNGDIIVVGRKQLLHKYRLYYHPSQSEKACKASKIYAESWTTGKITEEENKFLETFINKPLTDIALPDTSKRLKSTFGKQNVAQMLIEGVVGCTAPIQYTDSASESPLDVLARNNQISYREFELNNDVVILAQKNNIQDGMEFIQSYYENREKFIDSRDANEFHKRVGKLLGYTDNDIALANSTKYNSRLIKFVLKETNNIRRFARKEVLIADHLRTPKI